MEPVHKIYLTLIFLCSLLFLVMIYVLYVRHENTIENWKDLIDECYNRQERLKQQELFEAQYNVRLTVWCRSKRDFLIYIGMRLFFNVDQLCWSKILFSEKWQSCKEGLINERREHLSFRFLEWEIREILALMQKVRVVWDERQEEALFFFKFTKIFKFIELSFIYGLNIILNMPLKSKRSAKRCSTTAFNCNWAFEWRRWWGPKKIPFYQ